MTPTQLRERIQQLRDAASRTRESAYRAERYHVEFQELQNAARLDKQADELEALLKSMPA